jgi:glycosyltransferase involved in cell wall biosynthesis
MRGVHQVLAGAAPRDAITNHALEARLILREMGFRSELFAEGRHTDGSLKDRIHPHTEWGARTRPGDAVIVHYSIESPAFDYVMQRAGVVGMQYHNITPPDLLWRYSPGLALQCAQGRAHLASLTSRVQYASADSQFNADELIDLGFDDPAVIGILRDRARTAVSRTNQGAGPRLLFVGRGVANKCQDDLIVMLASLRQTGVPADLRLVGAWGPGNAFEGRCRWLAKRLGVDDSVAFLGSVPDHVLDAEYAAADIFVCMSRHEGFCVPVIEAMEAGLPIVARAAGAVPETVGHGGVLLDAPSPSTMAEAVSSVLGADGSNFAAGRRDQLDHHSAQATGQRLREFAERLT